MGLAEVPLEATQAPFRLASTREVPARAEFVGGSVGSVQQYKPVVHGPDLGRMFKTTIHDIKEFLGLVPECFNGGTKISGGRCHCPKLYSGAQCETIQCLNNGTRVAIAKMTPTSYHCKCPFPEFISGNHCDTVRCANGGNLMSNATCQCTDMWHNGRFCENFAVQSWPMLLIPIVIVLLIIFLCAICRMDWCPRRNVRSSHSRAARPSGRQRRRPVAGYPTRADPRGVPATGVLVQEHLLGEERGDCMRGPAYPEGVVAPYVIRLDTIPTFNPSMIGGVDPGDEETKIVEPPPSYEQAMAIPRPPEYSPPLHTAPVPPTDPLSSRVSHSRGGTPDSRGSQPPPPNRPLPTPPR